MWDFLINILIFYSVSTAIYMTAKLCNSSEKLIAYNLFKFIYLLITCYDLFIIIFVLVLWGVFKMFILN